MTLDEINRVHGCMMEHLRGHVRPSHDASDLMVILAGMVADTILNISKPEKHQGLATAFSALIIDRLDSMKPRDGVH